MSTERRGFTLIEVAVWVAVLAILAATVTPALLAVVDAERRDRAITLLERFEAGVNAFDGDVNTYPGAMSQLFQGIAGGDRDLCNATYKGNDANRWEGPYVHVVPGASGYPVVVGSVADAFAYQVLGGTPYLRMTVNNVLQEDAEALDGLGDNGDGANAGKYRWGAPNADGFVTMTYNVVVQAC